MHDAIPSESPSSPAAEARLGGPAHATLGVLSRASEQLLRAWRGCALYGVEHPVVRAAAQSAWQELREAVRDGDGLVLGIARGALLLDGHVVQDPDALQTTSRLPGALTLADALYALDLGALQVSHAVELQDVLRLVALLDESERFQKRGAEAAECLNNALSPKFRFAAVSYASLQVQDVGAAGQAAGRTARQDATDDPADLGWLDAMMELLVGAQPTRSGTRPSASSAKASPSIVKPASHDPPAIATRANQQLSASNPRHVAVLRQHLDRLQQSARETDSDQRGWLQQRIRSFVDHLDPHLRERLLLGTEGLLTASDTDSTSAGLRRMIDWSDALPAQAVIDSLETLEKNNAKPASATVLLMARLARSYKHDAQGFEKIQGIHDRWSQRLAQESPEEARCVQQAIYDLFESRSDRDFTPQPYQERLVSLSTLGPQSNQSLVGESPFEPAVIKPHLLAVALACLPHPCEDIQALQAPWDYLHDHVEEALTHARPLLAVATLDAARATLSRWLASPTVQSDTERLAALRLLDKLSQPRTLHAVLRLARTLGQLNDDLRKLLELAGPVVVEPILKELPQLSHKQQPLREALDSILARFPGRVVQAAQAIASHDDPTLAPMLQSLDKLSAEQALAVLDPLRCHGDPRVRLHAYETLARVWPKWSLRVVGDLLAEHDRPFTTLALSQLSALPHDPAEPGLLMQHLLHYACAAQLDAWSIEQIASTLVKRSDTGRDLVIDLLRKHELSMRSHHARLALHLALSIQSRRSDPVIASALRRFRFTPAFFRTMWYDPSTPHEHHASAA